MKSFLFIFLTFLGVNSLVYATESNDLAKKKILNKIELTGKYDRFRLEDIPEGLQKDRDIVLAAITKNPENIEFADDSFKNDVQVVIATLKAQNKQTSFFVDDKPDVTEVLQHIGEKLSNNETSMLRLMDEEPISVKFIGKNLKKDKQFILKAIKKTPSALAFADMNLSSDKELVLKAVEIDGLSLEYADTSLKKDKDVVLAALKNNPSSLRFADFSLKTNIDFRNAQKEQMDNNLKPKKKSWN